MAEDVIRRGSVFDHGTRVRSYMTPRALVFQVQEHFDRASKFAVFGIAPAQDGRSTITNSIESLQPLQSTVMTMCSYAGFQSKFR